MGDKKRIIPEEWYYFEDWLAERAEQAKKNAIGFGESDEYYEHYEFVRREWIAHIANTIRESDRKE